MLIFGQKITVVFLCFWIPFLFITFLIKYNIENYKEWKRAAAPTKGKFIAFKKVIGVDDEDSFFKDMIAVLEIPEDAQRVTTTKRSYKTYKCRADKVKVLSINTLDGKLKYTKAFSKFNAGTKYEIGKMVYADKFDDDPKHECSHGINFFMNLEDAIHYN